MFRHFFWHLQGYVPKRKTWLRKYYRKRVRNMYMRLAMRLYRAFRNVIHDYKYLQQQNQRSCLSGIVHSHRKTEQFFWQPEMFDVCIAGTHRYDIQVLATHASTWVHRYSLLQWSVPLGQRGHVAMAGQARIIAAVKNISSCQNNFFSFHVAVNSSIKVSPLVL
jgi:hypothetical protein